MRPIRKILIGSTIIALLVMPWLIANKTQKSLRRENRVLREQIAEYRKALEGISSQLAAVAHETEQPHPDQRELLRLRGELGRLRRQIGELEILHSENAPLQGSLNSSTRVERNSISSADVVAAKAAIFDSAKSVQEKLIALGTLRSANARSDDVVIQMVQVYYTTDDRNWRADIFRQLKGVATPELKAPLLEAVSDAGADSNVRQEAAETLVGYLPDPDVKAWLDHLAAQDADDDVREQAKKTLQAYQRRNGQR